MGKENIIDYTLKRLDFNETKIRESLQDIADLKLNLEIQNKFPEIGILELLSSEKYRFKVAIDLAKNNIEAAKMLGTTERTFYRKIKEFKLNI